MGALGEAGRGTTTTTIAPFNIKYFFKMNQLTSEQSGVLWQSGQHSPAAKYWNCESRHSRHPSPSQFGNLQGTSVSHSCNVR
jgi:hypothetical protein